MSRGPQRTVSDTALETARELFLREDNDYGCAEATLVALQQCYGFDDADDSSAAIIFNGGIAYAGGICGAISGAAIAVGRLADKRIPDHAEAKSAARGLIQPLMAEFESEYGGCNCSDLIDYDISIPAQHDAFIESGVWRETCMGQIEFSVSWLSRLADPDAWDKTIEALGR